MEWNLERYCKIKYKYLSFRVDELMSSWIDKFLSLQIDGVVSLWVDEFVSL